MLRKEGKRLGAGLILAAALAVTLAVPAEAAGRSGWGEAREQILGGFLERVLGWLGLAPAPGAGLKCDQGSSIEPNGCPKSGEQGTSIDPNGSHAAEPATGERGSSIDPDGQS